MYKFQDCLRSELDSIEIDPGTLIFCRDSGDAFYDTLEGDRVPVSSDIVILKNEAERTGLLTPESGILYVVQSSRMIWLYIGGWISLSPGARYYFDIENVELPKAGEEPVTVVDERIGTACVADFVPIPAISNIYQGATLACGDGKVVGNAVGEYNMIGTIKISYTPE